MPAEVSSNMARYDGVKYGLRKEGMIFWKFTKTRGEDLAPKFVPNYFGHICSFFRLL